jgi:hypothetical protein
VEGDGAEEGEAVDKAEVDAAGEEEEGAVEEEEEEGAGEVAVVDEVLVDAAEGVEDGECLRGRGGGLAGGGGFGKGGGG